MKETKVTLISHTKFPIETVYLTWQSSRTDDVICTPVELSDKRHKDQILNSQVMEIFNKCVMMQTPIVELLDFVFLVENLPIALREQLVRHRVGHKFGEAYGADVIPDLVSSTFWSQTMRVKDMGNFATNEDFLYPEWLKEHGQKKMSGFKLANECPQCHTRDSSTKSDHNKRTREVWCWNCRKTFDLPYNFNSFEEGTLEEFYEQQMRWIQSAYRRLVRAGMPIEDARNIIPLGAMHRLVWKCNLASILHIFQKRGCWFSQLGMWEPLIRGMVNELATKVDPYFRRAIDPPCFNQDGIFTECKVKKEIEQMLTTQDQNPPCPLYMNHHEDEARSFCKSNPEISKIDIGPILGGWAFKDKSVEKKYSDRSKKYGDLWGRNPFTGEKV